VVIYTDGSVVRNQRGGWELTARSGDMIVYKASGAFARTMEIMVATKVFIWLESQNYTHVCISSDSLSMIRKIVLSGLSL
jgi:ribonuclease HI